MFVSKKFCETVTNVRKRKRKRRLLSVVTGFSFVGEALPEPICWCRRRADLAATATKLIAPVLALALVSQVAQAADRYVDAAAPEHGTGASWPTAWRHFSDIDWSLLGPGDTLHIAGRGCAGAYTETLVVGASGQDGAPLIITGDSRSGAAAPVIDGQNRQGYGVVLRGRNHVTVRDLGIRNHAEAGILVRDARAGVLIEGNDIFSGDPGGGNARGIDARGNAGARPLVVRANRFATPDETAAQTDGIWSSDNDGVLFEGNRIVIANRNTRGHSDGLQSFHDHSIVIRGNWIEQDNDATVNNHGIWASDTRQGGRVTITGNVILAPNLTADSVVTHWAEPDWNEDGSVAILNNTIIGGRRAINLDRSPRAEVRSNILLPAAGGDAVAVRNGAVPPGNIDNNLVWSPNGYAAHLDGQARDWSGWRALGYERAGVQADPQLHLDGAHRVRIEAVALVRGRGASLPAAPASDRVNVTCPSSR